MFFSKFLLGIIFFASLQFEEGWVPVERVSKSEDSVLDVDLSGGVLFLKKIDDFQITLRFPIDPLDLGHGVYRADVDGEIYELIVDNENLEPISEMQEQIVMVNGHIFRLRTTALGQKAVNFFANFSQFS